MSTEYDEDRGLREIDEDYYARLEEYEKERKAKIKKAEHPPMNDKILNILGQIVKELDTLERIIELTHEIVKEIIKDDKKIK
jgi:DNA replication initiation complex subunit (GINS family)